MELRLGDIAHGGVIRQPSTIIQQKTGRPVPFEITEAATEALAHWLERRGRRREAGLIEDEGVGLRCDVETGFVTLEKVACELIGLF